MQIEVLVVPECPNEIAATELIQIALRDTGVCANVTCSVIATEQHARERGFTGSPTILLDGVDPFATPRQAVGLSCRLYATPAGLRGVPTLTELRSALRHVGTT
ncbi:hypothetical protein J4030_10370 [Allobranchiibius sp. CTAmp26]|nr:hypothetical protein [Allobranchiibius sp. CTAmp26]